MSTATPCYENGTAVERICHPPRSVYQHCVLILSMLEKTLKIRSFASTEGLRGFFSSIEPTLGVIFLYKIDLWNVERGVGSVE